MQYRHFERGTSNGRSGALQSSSFIRHSQEEDQQESSLFAQRENFQSILASQRHAEILESLKRLTTSVVELQRSNEVMRNDFDQKICELHQLLDTFQPPSNVPLDGSQSPATSVEQDIMTVEDYMHGRKNRRLEPHGGFQSGDPCEVLLPTLSTTTGGGPSCTSRSPSFFDDIFMDDQDSVTSHQFRDTSTRRVDSSETLRSRVPVPTPVHTNTRRRSSNGRCVWGGKRVGNGSSSSHLSSTHQLDNTDYEIGGSSGSLYSSMSGGSI